MRKLLVASAAVLFLGAPVALAQGSGAAGDIGSSAARSGSVPAVSSEPQAPVKKTAKRSSKRAAKKQ